jgi:phosphoenolpyruvate synthase/pyruvate phosphate dikinase
LQNVSKTIRDAFVQAEFDANFAKAIDDAYDALMSASRAAVAVRSSATAEDLPGLSFAGQHDTVLNVANRRDLHAAIKKCFGSLFNESAIAYRVRNNIPTDAVAMAVVVQCMIRSSRSGVLFTANVWNGDRTQMVIDATTGVGEALVSGQVVPDHIVVDAASARVISSTAGDKAMSIVCDDDGGTSVVKRDLSVASTLCLTNDEIRHLVQKAKTVLALYDNTPLVSERDCLCGDHTVGY